MGASRFREGLRIGPVPHCRTQCFPHSGGIAELRGKVGEKLDTLKLRARRPDLVAQDVAIGKSLEQGHQVGKRLVKGENVGVGRLDEIGAQAMDDGVRHFMGDDVMAQAAEHHLPWQIGARLACRSSQMAEQNRVQLAVEEGVGTVKGMQNELLASAALRCAGM